MVTDTGIGRVLLVKTSSLGDLVHLLPALTEAAAQHPDLRFDWLVEEAFAEIPAWHPAVARVIPVSLRSWRREPVAVWRDGRWRRFVERLRGQDYELVVDAQGLLKSAVLASRARGRRAGPDFTSAREPLAALAYGRRLAVPPELHAITRMRRLLGLALGHVPDPDHWPGYGLDARLASLRAEHGSGDDRVLLLHGTSWANKHWPEPHWIDLARRLRARGLVPTLPWGSETERTRAERIATAADGEMLPRGDLAALFRHIDLARGLVGVDSGLVHLAAATDTPGVALYGPTDPARTGVVGGRITSLAAELPCAPCLRRVCRTGEPPRIDPASGSALEPPCMGGLAPERVERLLLERMETPAAIGAS
jgi:heptosyltransferase-1